MKNLLAFTMCVLASMTTMFAQEEETQQETIGFIGNYCLGDTMVYRYHDIKEKFHEQDTIIEQYVLQDFMIAVIDSTADSYRFEVTPLHTEFRSDQEYMQIVQNCLAQVGQDQKVSLLTDQFGVLQHIENWMEIRDNIKKGVAMAMDSLFAKVPDIDKVLSRRQFESQIMSAYLTEPGVMSSYPELLFLFQLNGRAYPVTTISQKGLNEKGFPTETDIIIQRSEVKLDTDSPEDYEMSALSVTTVSAKDALDIAKNQMGAMMTEEAAKKFEELPEAEMEENLGKDMKVVNIEQYQYFHNGWGKNIIFDQEVNAKMPLNHHQRKLTWVRKNW